MNFSQSNDFKSKLDRIRVISAKIDKKLPHNEERFLASLSEEELKDFQKLVQIADYIVCKHEEKSDLCQVLREFSSMINESYSSMQDLDDETNELIVSAEAVVGKMRDIQTNFTDDCDLTKSRPQKSILSQKSSPINFTKSSIEIHTQGYQPSSKREAEII